MLVSAIHQPTAALFPGESHGQRSLEGYSPKGGRVRHPWSNLARTNPRCSRAVVPSIFGTRDQFCGRQFSHGPWGWFGDDSNALHLLCTLFILLLYQLPLRSSGIRSQRLGTPALEAAPCVNSTRSSWCSEPCSALATFPFCKFYFKPSTPPTACPDVLQQPLLSDPCLSSSSFCFPSSGQESIWFLLNLLPLGSQSPNQAQRVWGSVHNCFYYFL